MLRKEPRNKVEEALLFHLQQMATFYKEMMANHPRVAQRGPSVEERLLSEGGFFEPQHLPREYKLQKLKQCYMNAQNLVAIQRVPGLRYVEGIAHSGIIPVQHAFCVDENNRVVDVTWRTRGKWGKSPEEKAYFGIIFPTEKIVENMVKKELYTSLMYDWVD
jgi:hypothetical protein